MAALLVTMAANAIDVVVIIFALTALDSNRPIPASRVDVEDMSVVIMVMVEEMVTMDEAAMVPLPIAYVISVMVTVNLWPLGNIFILLMNIQSLRFLAQPGSFAKKCLLYYGQDGFYNCSHTTSELFLVLPNKTLLSPNMMKLPLRKATSLHIQIFP